MDKSFFKGMLSGVVIGGVLSVIFMPESGRKVADKVREKAKDISKKIKSRREELSEITEEADEFLGSLLERGKLTEEQVEELSKMLNKFVKTK